LYFTKFTIFAQIKKRLRLKKHLIKDQLEKNYLIRANSSFGS